MHTEYHLFLSNDLLLFASAFIQSFTLSPCHTYTPSLSSSLHPSLCLPISRPPSLCVCAQRSQPPIPATLQPTRPHTAASTPAPSVDSFHQFRAAMTSTPRSIREITTKSSSLPLSPYPPPPISWSARSLTDSAIFVRDA